MSVSIRQVGTVANVASGSSVSVAYPANQTDDVLVLYVSSGRTMGTPSGWTLMGSYTGVSGYQTYLWWRRVTTTLAGSQGVLNTSGTSAIVGVMVSYQGVIKSGNPHTDANVSAASASNNSVSVGSITVASPIYVVGGAAYGSWSTTTTGQNFPSLSGLSGDELLDTGITNGKPLMLWAGTATGGVSSSFTATASQNTGKSMWAHNLIAAPEPISNASVVRTKAGVVNLHFKAQAP